MNWVDLLGGTVEEAALVHSCPVGTVKSRRAGLVVLLARLAPRLSSNVPPAEPEPGGDGQVQGRWAALR